MGGGSVLPSSCHPVVPSVCEKPLNAERSGAFLIGAGDGLLSRVLSDGVPSALQVLTSVFGMGTGVAPAL